MRSQKVWFVCLVLAGLLGGMMGCQASNDEEARAQIAALTADLTTVQADVAGLNTRSADLAGQTAAAQGTMEALAAAPVAAETAVAAPAPTLEMSLRTALEVIYQDGQPPQSAFFPIDRLAFYNSYDEFKADWTNERDLQSWVKLAFLPDPTPEAWQLYYNTDVIADTATWVSPFWRSYVIKTSWQPNPSQAGIVPGETKVEQGERLTITGHTSFLAGAFMSEGLDELDAVVTANGGDLNTLSPMMFLVHERFQGRDDLVLVIIEQTFVGPDPGQDSPLQQYCSRCTGFWCRWRCWRY